MARLLLPTVEPAGIFGLAQAEIAVFLLQAIRVPAVWVKVHRVDPYPARWVIASAALEMAKDRQNPGSRQPVQERVWDREEVPFSQGSEAPVRLKMKEANMQGPPQYLWSVPVDRTATVAVPERTVVTGALCTGWAPPLQIVECWKVLVRAAASNAGVEDLAYR